MPLDTGYVVGSLRAAVVVIVDASATAAGVAAAFIDPGASLYHSSGSAEQPPIVYRLIHLR